MGTMLEPYGEKAQIKVFNFRLISIKLACKEWGKLIHGDLRNFTCRHVFQS